MATILQRLFVDTNTHLLLDHIVALVRKREVDKYRILWTNS